MAPFRTSARSRTSAARLSGFAHAAMSHRAIQDCHTIFPKRERNGRLCRGRGSPRRSRGRRKAYHAPRAHSGRARADSKPRTARYRYVSVARGYSAQMGCASSHVMGQSPRQSGRNSGCAKHMARARCKRDSPCSYYDLTELRDDAEHERLVESSETLRFAPPIVLHDGAVLRHDPPHERERLFGKRDAFSEHCGPNLAPKERCCTWQ